MSSPSLAILAAGPDPGTAPLPGDTTMATLSFITWFLVVAVLAAVAIWAKSAQKDVRAALARWKAASPALAPWLFLLLGLLPTPLMLAFIKSTPPPFLPPVWLGCCLVASYGLLRNRQPILARILLTLLLSAGFAVLNLILAVAIGCSRGGRISP